MNKFLIFFLLVASNSLVAASDFTPDHLEGTYRGSSRSERIPDYCMFDARREVEGQNIVFNMEVSHHAKVIAKFTMTSEEIAKNLNSHLSYFDMKTDHESLQINISNKEILNFMYIKTDDQNKVLKILSCSAN